MPLQNNCLKNKEGKQHLFAIPHVAHPNVQQRQIEIITMGTLHEDLIDLHWPFFIWCQAGTEV